MIALVVDSNSQMPPDLAGRLGAIVVPLTVEIDGVAFREGVDLDADRFYEAWNDGHVPEITTSQPAPGLFVEAYDRAIAAGATEILSIHVAESMSGTINSARLAAGLTGVPVRLVDTGTASFGISCCAWAAADALSDGADVESAALVAEARAATLHTTFVVGVPHLMDRSGRADGIEVEAAASDGIAVIALTGPDLSVLATVSELDEAVEVMAADALSRTPTQADGLRIAIGTSDESSRPMSVALTSALASASQVADVVQYRIGPSIGAHTGPGTAGLFVF